MTTEIRQLLDHLDAGRRIRETIACARRLAADNGACIAAVHAPVPAMAELPMIPGLGPAAESFVEFEKERRRAVRSSFERAMRDPGPAAETEWGEVSGVPLAGAFAAAGFHADLLVLVQPDPATGELPDSFGTIAIGWKPTREAARAVSGAIPLLRKALQVHVFAWGADHEPAAPLNLAGYLRVHGIKVQWHVRSAEPAHAGEQLMASSADVRADLLVMGCYGHSRAGEWVLGGASRTVLRSTALPVLMAH
jgi:nucleotide-binding universal stress UspA family protein